MRKLLLSLTMLMAGAMAVWAQTSTHGPIVTFTNVQQDGTTYTLYINEDKVLATSTDNVEVLGDAAKFRATLKDDGKYTFYNESEKLYMIWRGKGAGHNSDKGVLAEYNPTYCDWTMNASANLLGGCYFVSKRNDGSDGSLVIMKQGGNFDAYGNSEGWASNFSNVYRISGDEYISTLTDTEGLVHECKATGLPLFGATISNPNWSNGNLTADVEFTIPVSNVEVTNRVVISTFNNYNNKYFADGTSVKANRNSGTPLPSNVDAKNYLWAFYPALEGSIFKFKVKNIGTGTYIKSESNQSDHSGDEVSLEADDATLFALTSSNQLVNGKGYRLSVNSETGNAIQYVGTYNSDHNGTKNKIVNANNYTLSLSDGSTYVGTNGVHNLMGGSYAYTDGAWSDNGYSADVEFSFSSLPFAISTQEAINAMFISSFKGDSHQADGSFKWRTSDDNNNVAITKSMAVDAENLDKHLWAIYPVLVKGAFNYAIKSIAADNYIYTEAAYANNSGSADSNKDAVTLQDNPTYFSTNAEGQFFYTAEVSGNNVTQYLSLGSVNTADGYLNVYAKNHGGTKNSFHTPVTIGKTSYSTLYSPIALSIPEGITAYTGTLNGEWLTLNKVQGMIPANTAVVLKAETPSTIYAFAATTSTESITDNALKGAATNVETSSITEGVVYTLQSHDNGVAFKKYKGNNLVAGKAYLVLSDEQQAIGIRFEDGTTGIDHSELTIQNSELIFDLMGRRVETMTEGNIYIVNGKKVVIK